MEKYLNGIKALDKEAMKQAQARLDSLVKPPGSLGVLEEVAVRLAGISGQLYYDTSKRAVVIMAADNGVVAEGIASAPQSVTHMQTLNFTRNVTGVSAIAKAFATDLIVVDVGVKGEIKHNEIRNRKLRMGTGNIAKEPAMSLGEAKQAVMVGIDCAIEAANAGYSLLGAGEMGIGNTTTSAAVLCALTGASPEKTTGKGAGLSEDAYRRKIEVIGQAIALHKPDPADPLDVLAKVGGLDIAAMAGLYIGGAYMGVPVVIDGFISTVAALAATRLQILVKEYIFASHLSFEQGARYASESVGLRPSLHLNMRLGEGSGCPLMFAVMDAASAVIRDMGTFEEAQISDEYMEKIDEGSFLV